jgi:amino acid adenylation domain-containing protein
MVPSYLRRIDELPMTVNGKLDLKNLPQIERGGGETYVAPMSKVEEKLVEIWSELLKLEKEKISVDKSFFELGGHSLKAITMTSLISKEFDVRIPLTGLFKIPTIKQLGLLIEADRHEHKHIAIPVAPVMDFYPLSYPQRRLYLLNQLDQQSLAYNTPYAVRLHGDINPRRLEKIFRQLIGRHESLRTSFVLEGDQPVQKIAAAADLAITVFDPAAGRAEDLIRSFIRPFRLDKAPLMRVGLMWEKEDTAVLVVDMHHIISDGVSQQQLMKEFQSLYRYEPLAPQALQYKDYTQWQHSEEQQLEIRRQQAFWLEKYSSTPATIDLPADHPRPSAKDFAGGMVELPLSRLQTLALKKLAESEGCTVFMVLLSVYSILVSKLTGSEDIVIGTSTAGRQHADLENIVGMFVNTLPLRTRPVSKLSFKEFLATLSSDTIACFDHQGYPYEELIDELQLERDFSRNPLFDIMFAHQHLEPQGEGSPGLTVSSFASDHRVAKFDLTLSVTEGEGNVQLGFEYASALFTQETIERFAGYYSRILAAVTANSELRLSETGLLSQSEAAWIDEWNQTGVLLPAEDTVLSIIGRQPLAQTAVECEGVNQTYAQLAELSDRIGGWLRASAGIRKGDRVGVLMGRELNLPAVLIGVWKAGAAYVPIDPSYPKERIDDILKDGEVKYVLDSEAVKKIVPDEGVELSGGELPGQDDLAYVLFTSGSTGRPKGVMISHRSLLNYMSWASASYFENAPAVLPLFTSVSFDLTLTSIFTPLISGGKVVVYNEEEAATLLKRILDNKELTGIKLTPSHLRIVRELAGAAGVFWAAELGMGAGWTGLRKWIVGGEDLETELARSIVNLFGSDTEIYNEYGPTEATVGCMIYRYTGLEAGASVPIGRPAWNTNIYLLDKDGHRVPVGVEAEIYIGGEGLAKGYLNRDELTAERFISDERGRLYRTGDLGVMNTKGEVVFRGRRDEQVKLRGYRMELGEIGSRLSKHPSAGEAVAVIREIGGEKTLVAYYTGSGDAEVLRDWLGTQLPAYMVPSYLRRIDELPVTVNGKLDGKRLPEIERGEGEVYVAPTSEVEEQLVAIWSELLQLEKEKISIDKSFFELGGNSLKLVQLNTVVNKTLNWNITVAVLFRYTTIASLVKYVREGEDNPEVYKQEVSDELADMENMLDLLSNTNLFEHEQF